ncbi:MAG: hypothetical protein ACI4OY_14020 [Aristaeellaceae bacterium]
MHEYTSGTAQQPVLTVLIASGRIGGDFLCFDENTARKRDNPSRLWYDSITMKMQRSIASDE